MLAHRKTVLYSLAGAALLAGIGIMTLAATAQQPEGVVPEGVHVAGMDWSNKPSDTARAELAEWGKQRASEALRLALPSTTHVKRTWSPTRADIGASVDLDATLAASLAGVKDEGLVARLSSLFQPHRQTDIAPTWKLDEAKLRRYLTRRIAPRALRPKKDARLLILKEGIRKIAEQPGAALDVKGAIAAVREHLSDSSSAPLVLPVVPVAPRVTLADLQGIDSLVSSYSTDYAETGNRARNIQVACSNINGTVLKPGDVFSYNDIVGPRDADSGFHMAPVIVRGRLQPGMGGGVCQVSSTLYNAALYADLKIVRRTHHAFPVHYLPAGRDATVAYGSIDFQFANNTRSPIAIAASGSGGRVSMRIYGKAVPGREVKIERKEHSTWGPGLEIVHDSSLPAGERRVEDKGHAGHRVTVMRAVLMNGREVRREVVSEDRYQAFPRVVAVGTRAPRPVKKPAVSTPAPSAPAGTVPATLPPG